MSDKEEEHSELSSMLQQLEQSPEQDAATQASGAEPAAHYESPTLASIDEKRRPNPAPICQACPSSMWFSSAQHLKCYCRVMHVVTWSSEEPVPILSCDGILLPE